MQHIFLESKRLVLYQIPIYEQANHVSQWYSITEKKNQVNIGFIGMVHCHPEWNNTGVQIIISKEENRREGYALEALELLEQYVFEALFYQRIAVKIIDFNKPAIALFKKQAISWKACRNKDFIVVISTMILYYYVFCGMNIYVEWKNFIFSYSRKCLHCRQKMVICVLQHMFTI